MREQGYEELSDLLGERTGYGPLVRTGLLRRREVDTELQRYQGLVPTPKGEDLLIHLAEKELIMVRPGKSGAIMKLMEQDPDPQAPYKPTFAQPTKEQFDAAAHMRDQAGRDVWRVQRAEQLRLALLAGYMDFRMFTKRTGCGEAALIREELCSMQEERPHEHALHLRITKEGERYLTIADPWELLLVKPGMELPLFARCDAQQAAYWLAVP